MIICWWSGGVTSAVACKLAIDFYGKENCKAIMIDTRNEDEDTYRFKKDCEEWYQIPIETIDRFGEGSKYNYEKIQDVWYAHKSLNVATGAICSSELKKMARIDWEKNNEFTHQVFGFEFETREFKRAKSMKMNYGETSKPIFPLLWMGYDKKDCLNILEEAEIEVPRAYKWGLKNNNCLNTGCTQGGCGYWARIKEIAPDKFSAMSKIEHDLTNMKGHPVTMLKDQSNQAKEAVKAGDKFANLVFLEKHPDYPNKCLADMKPRPIEPLMECNGFCGTNELNPKSETELELNFGEI